MRLRRAVLKTPSRFSVPPRLPFYKGRPLLTPSESTLLQVLIPLHFNSPKINTYKKPGGGTPLATPKFYNSSLPVQSSCAATGIAATPIPSAVYFITRAHPEWGVSPTLRRAGRIYLASLFLCSYFDFSTFDFQSLPRGTDFSLCASTETNSAPPAAYRQSTPTQGTAAAAARALSPWSPSKC
jgi:hypothetical protein